MQCMNIMGSFKSSSSIVINSDEWIGLTRIEIEIRPRIRVIDHVIYSMQATRASNENICRQQNCTNPGRGLFAWFACDPLNHFHRWYVQNQLNGQKSEGLKVNESDPDHEFVKAWAVMSLSIFTKWMESESRTETDCCTFGVQGDGGRNGFKTSKGIRWKLVESETETILVSFIVLSQIEMSLPNKNSISCW
jgi:hypothetical protein